LHLNISGEKKLAELIGENVNETNGKKEETPFILQCWENQKNPTQGETKEKLTP
jgi:hypothetical protein